VDLHATTMPHDPKALRRENLYLATSLLACGLDPKKVSIYQQSQISAHSELAWIFSCITPKAWLEQMTQFKEKSSKKVAASLGLYSYPVLMAADIMIYGNNGNVIDVPVGDDQRQHLELARDITKRFNDLFAKDFFSLPNPVFPTVATRVMNLRDGLSKMSKSDPLDSSRINLNDENDSIQKKIAKSLTDSEDGISYDPIKRPGLSNLIDIYSSFAEISWEDLVAKYTGKGIPAFKKDMIEVVTHHVGVIREEIKRLQKDPEFVYSVLKGGRDESNEIAAETLKRVKEFVGYQ
jgi:tryptophanyl-tRNA synthetase